MPLKTRCPKAKRSQPLVQKVKKPKKTLPKSQEGQKKDAVECDIKVLHNLRMRTVRQATPVPNGPSKLAFRQRRNAKTQNAALPASSMQNGHNGELSNEPIEQLRNLDETQIHNIVTVRDGTDGIQKRRNVKTFGYSSSTPIRDNHLDLELLVDGISTIIAPIDSNEATAIPRLQFSHENLGILRHCEEPAEPNVAEACDLILPVEEDIPAVPALWESPKQDEKAAVPTPAKQASIGDGSPIKDKPIATHDWGHDLIHPVDEDIPAVPVHLVKPIHDENAAVSLSAAQPTIGGDITVKDEHVATDHLVRDPAHPVVEDIPAVPEQLKRSKQNENAVIPTSAEQGNIGDGRTIKDELLQVQHSAPDPAHPFVKNIPEVPAQLKRPNRDENAAASMSAKQPSIGDDITVKDEPVVVTHEQLKTERIDKPQVETSDVPLTRAVKKPIKNYPICCIESLRNVGHFPAIMWVKRRPNNRSVKTKSPSAYPQCPIETVFEDRT